MKKSLFILILSSFLLASCDIPFLSSAPKEESGDKQSDSNENQSGSNSNSGTNSNNGTNTSTNTGDNGSTNTGENTNTDNNNTSTEDDDARLLSVYFDKKVLDIKLNGYKYAYLSFITNSNITSDDLTDEEKAGVFASSDPSIATVSEHGRIDAVGIGSAVITYTTTLGHLVASMTVYTWNSLDDIVREYIRLDDPDDIQVGDELIFACPDFGVAASVNIQGGYIIPAPCTFSSDRSKITEKSQYVAEYYVGPGDTSENFTFENQQNCYLAGKTTTMETKLVYSQSGRAQKNWIAEIPDGYSETFIVNDDLIDTYWLMFNKVSKNDNSDIRFNLYDSNELDSMKKPIIYRKTTIRD